MNDTVNLGRPAALKAIEHDTITVGFTMISETKTGALLRTLAASKPGGALLELGTGTGASTAWILEGMDSAATLLTVDGEAKYVEIAQRHLARDRRVTFHVGDGALLLRELRERKFDLIFADTWPGKFDHLQDALALLCPGGFYVSSTISCRSQIGLMITRPKCRRSSLNSSKTRGSLCASFAGRRASSSPRASRRCDRALARRAVISFEARQQERLSGSGW